MVSTWWLVAAFFAGVGQASLLFALMNMARDLPQSVQSSDEQLGS